jgi:hypothetical protein
MWAFLLFDGFLVVGLASGILPALSNFKQFASTASSIPTKLATSLPTSSIFCACGLRPGATDAC